MLENLQKYNIILGSASPRRAELLKGLNIPFQIIAFDVDETYPDSIASVDIPTYLARKKAIGFNLDNNTLLITADTIVWLDGKVYGKPSGRNEAKKMLQTLSGKKHQVITGVCIKTKKREKVFHVVTDVYFAHFTDEEIEFYLDEYAPYDKAGAYGIQEWIGYIGVERIEGSYFNVMGLPIQRLYRELRNIE